jgi:hypothetical protein
MKSSCVNDEIKIFNRGRHKIMKLENNVKILDFNLDRSCHTKHGLHLNTAGKERVIEMVINQLMIPKIKNKMSVTAQDWVQNSEEYYHRNGMDKIRKEDKDLQQEDKEEEKEEDRESENLSDCDETMRVHKNVIDRKDTRNQQIATVRNREAERDNLD